MLHRTRNSILAEVLPAGLVMVTCSSLLFCSSHAAVMVPTSAELADEQVDAEMAPALITPACRPPLSHTPSTAEALPPQVWQSLPVPALTARARVVAVVQQAKATVWLLVALP